jgi:glycosyltransferase involved in cell wall biosynthesis
LHEILKAKEMTRVSVVMAVKNGSTYINEQIDSILLQIGRDDEIIVSDDHSTDNTVDLLKEYNDSRIKIHRNPFYGLLQNFENSLQCSTGEYIFLCDQDDVWRPGKVSTMMRALQTSDLVTSDCSIADEELTEKHPSFYELNNSRPGLFRNIFRNSYMGCCMAFRRKILNRAMPFPKNIPMHDIWIGLIGEAYYKSTFITNNLVIHRRHSNNSSSTSEKSNSLFVNRIQNRISLLWNVLARMYDQ